MTEPEGQQEKSKSAEFFLAGGFEGVGGFGGWALGHPAFGVVAFFPGSIVFVPDVGQFYDRSGRFNCFERAHCFDYYLALEFGLIWRAGLVA